MNHFAAAAGSPVVRANWRILMRTSCVTATGVGRLARALFLTLFLGLLGSVATAQTRPVTERISAAVEAFANGRFKVDEVRATPLPGIFEVRIQNELLYVDEKARFMFYGGDLIDMGSRRNLTRERVEELLSIDFKELPLDLALSQKLGAGSRRIAVFEDPNCGYCKKLRADLLKLEDVTIYTFPMAFLAADSASKAARALCAPEPMKAWNELMLNNRVPANAGNCPTSIDKVADLARRLGITGTPVVFFESGERLQGYAPPDRFKAMLDKR
jgi:thiol:disulfide interchange protein DsbC